MRSAPLGQDVLFDEQNVELGRNFCNKLWNACRFRQMQGGDAEGEIDPALLSSDDKWILLRLDLAIREVTKAFSDYKFADATAVLYRFFWSEYCDWYVEASKAVLGGAGSAGTDDTGIARRENTLAVIDFVLSNMLRLFHPFLPFITEELWHGLGYHSDLPADQGGSSIQFARWPKPFDEDFKAHYRLCDEDERFVSLKYELVTQGRALRRQGNIASSKKARDVFKPSAGLPEREVEVLRILLNAEPLDVDPAFEARKGTPAALSPLGELYLPLEGVIDVEAEKTRLLKELAKHEAEIDKVRQKLDNPNFVQKVPPHVLEEHKQRLADREAKREQVKEFLAALEG
jgi:valyl-tRNA synthetase